jgi:CRP-like cAMP-binding protein
VISHNGLLSAMEIDDWDVLKPTARLLSFTSRQVLCEHDVRAASVYFPLDAVVSSLVVMDDGRDVETISVGFESAVGLLSALADAPQITRSYVQISGEAVAVPASAIRARVRESPALLTLVLRHALANAALTEQSAACNALHHLPARLARRLLNCQDRIQGPVMKLTQDYLSVATGALPSSISLKVSEFRDDGLIRYSRGVIQILDRKGLEGRACECYRAEGGVHRTLRRLHANGHSTDSSPYRPAHDAGAGRSFQ